MGDIESDEDLMIWKAFTCYEVQRSITQYLSLKDLKSLRLVSKQWMHSALISLKERSQIILDSPSSFQSYFTFLQTSSFCYTNYQIIVNVDKFDNKSQVKDLFRQFWDLCSGSTVDLTISIPWTCAFCILDYIYNENRWERLEKLSLNLQEVDISTTDKNWSVEGIAEAEVNPNSDVAGAHQQEEQQDAHKWSAATSLIALNLNVSIVLNSEKKVFPFTWASFFQTCPNVCHLSIQSDYASGHFLRIINVLAERKMHLKTLKIGTRDQRLFSEEFLKNLSTLTTSSTTTLSLGFLPPVNHESPLDSMLSQSAPSLRHLTFLQIRTTNRAPLICFTATDSIQFPNLTSLRITKELLPNLNFLVKMGKIRRLEIFRDSTIGQHDALSNPILRTSRLPEIGSLNSLVLEPFVPEDHVWKLVRWFPNLQRLQLKANDVIARIIFMSWKDLKELYLIAEISRDANDLVRSSLTDEGITGCSREFLQTLAYAGGSSQGEIQRNVAYIGNLKSLEVCKLQAVPDYQTGLTDHSIYFGLMDLPNLVSLTLVKTLISPVAADHLRQRNVSVTLSRN